MEAGNASFYKRVVSGVVICNMGVMYRFVPLLLMFSFHKAKGRSGKICRFGYLVKKTRVFNLPDVQVDSVGLERFSQDLVDWLQSQLF